MGTNGDCPRFWGTVPISHINQEQPMKIAEAFRKITRTVPVILLAVSVYADIHVSTSVDRGAVQYAISQASDDDTVLIPPGISTWTGNITITKGITLKGSGVDQTVIIDSTTNNYQSASKPIYMNVEAGKKWRITGLKFITSSDKPTGADQMIGIDGLCREWRVDHCRFEDMTGALRVLNVDTMGVVDNCTFYYFREFPSTEGAMRIQGDVETANTGPLTMGTSNAVYMEDNYMTCLYNLNGGNVNFMHTSARSRYVIRHNIINNSK